MEDQKNNNYLIISNDIVSIDNYIKKVIDTIKEEYEVIKFSCVDSNIDRIIEELDTISLTGIKKVVLYYDFDNLDSEKDVKLLERYLQNTSDNYLISVAATIKKTIFTKLSQYFCVYDTNLSSDTLIRDNLDGYKMDSYTINYFAKHCLNNNEKIVNELNKLKILKLDDKVITIEDINENVIKDYEDDPFLLPNLISKKDKKRAIEVFNRISAKEKDPIKILGMISHQIRTLYTVKVLSKKMNIDEISNLTGLKSYPITLAHTNSDNFTEKELLNMLEKLSDIDIRSKSESGSVDLLFELFILGL